MTDNPRFPQIESFSPHLLNLLIAGSKGEVRVPVDSYRDGVRFQQRLSRFRKRLRVENHPMSKVVANVTVRLKWGEAVGLPPVEEIVSKKKARSPRDRNVPAVLVVEPTDRSFEAVIQRAGLALDTRDLLSPEPTSGSSIAEGDGDFEALLDELDRRPKTSRGD